LSGAADRYDHREDNDYYSHAGALFRLMNDEQKALLVSNIAGAMAVSATWLSVSCSTSSRPIRRMEKQSQRLLDVQLNEV
jgi:catalase